MSPVIQVKLLTSSEAQLFSAVQKDATGLFTSKHQINVSVTLIAAQVSQHMYFIHRSNMLNKK